MVKTITVPFYVVFSLYVHKDEDRSYLGPWRENNIPREINCRRMFETLNIGKKLIDSYNTKRVLLAPTQRTRHLRIIIRQFLVDFYYEK